MMRKPLFSLTIITTLVCLNSVIVPWVSFAQQTGAPTPSAPATAQTREQERDSVVRITTQLIQIDTIVTDKRGEHVDDLKAEDFELLVDGKAQPLSFFKLVRFAASPAAAPKAKTAANPVPALPARLGQFLLEWADWSE